MSFVMGPDKAGRHILDSRRVLADHLAHSGSLINSNYYYGEAALPSEKSTGFGVRPGYKLPFLTWELGQVA